MKIRYFCALAKKKCPHLAFRTIVGSLFCALPVSAPKRQTFVRDCLYFAVLAPVQDFSNQFCLPPSQVGSDPSGDDGESNDAFSSVKDIAGFSDATAKRESDGRGQTVFEDAVDELDDLVAGMNTFVSDTSAGLEGAEVNALAGDVQFDVDKFMSLLNGADLRCVGWSKISTSVYLTSRCTIDVV